jgi:hypothetical protein
MLVKEAGSTHNSPATLLYKPLRLARTVLPPVRKRVGRVRGEEE